MSRDQDDRDSREKEAIRERLAELEELFDVLQNVIAELERVRPPPHRRLQ